jgi:spore germination cell wall hydrolase CwlJ-like protein
MSNIVDKICAYLALVAVAITPLATWIVLNVTQRPDTITVVHELPQRKPVIEIYEFGPDEEFPPPYDRFAYHDTDEITDIVVDGMKERNYTEHDLQCMALNIYFEAREESIKGQLAVGLVTMNRVDSPYFPNNVCDVVYQHMQFSWYWDGKSDRPIYLEKYKTAKLIASALLDRESQFYDFTYGSDHYHADYVDPYWNKNMIRVVQVDTHIFYKDPSLNLSL